MKWKRSSELGDAEEKKGPIYVKKKKVFHGCTEHDSAKFTSSSQGPGL